METVIKKCLICKSEFEPKNSKAQFCSTKCRVAYCRAKKRNDLMKNQPKTEITLVCNNFQTLPQPHAVTENNEFLSFIFDRLWINKDVQPTVFIPSIQAPTLKKTNRYSQISNKLKGTYQNLKGVNPLA